MSNVLVIEDEAAISEMIVFTLEKDGHDSRVAGSISQAEAMIDKQLPEVILLDWMLPDRSGIEFLRKLKTHAETSSIPVIFLTAKSDSGHKVEGLDAGADDYITKPFSPNVLLARIRAVLRRSHSAVKDEVVEIAGLRLDVANHRITVLKTSVELGLAHTEFRLLEFFMTHPNKVYSRSSLLDHIWGESIFLEERTVDVHINRLRKILRSHMDEPLVHTVRSVGYRFAEL